MISPSPAYALSLTLALVPMCLGADAPPPGGQMPGASARPATLGGYNAGPEKDARVFWNDRPDQAQVMAATFVGGKGAEWLCAGGFATDGIVLAGNINGGEFTAPIPETVLGTDGARPDPAVFASTTDKRGRVHVERPGWLRPDTTGFLVFTSHDLGTFKKVVRLPWNSGAITGMALGQDGSIYIAGRPGAEVARLGGRQQALTIPAEAARKGGLTTAAFLAKVNPTATAVEWVFTATGTTDVPKVTIDANGRIVFAAQDLRAFTPDGKQVSAIVVPDGLSEKSSVSPIDGTVLTGGDRNTGTGREPWRCPILRVLEPNGTLRYQLYEWPAGYVVLDNSRAVSDTSVFRIRHDRDGNILLQCWSDGGNSVAVAEPTDLRSRAPMRGVGLNAAGAGAMAFNYLVKLDPKDYKITGWTMWTGRSNGKPTSVGIEALDVGDDGSVLFSGGAAWGLIQTSNKLADGNPAEAFVTVLTPDMSGVRFSSTVPGLGAASLGVASIAIGHGLVNGKPRALFVGGATAEENVYGKVTATPLIKPAQGAFGGGACDGYVIMVDLAAGTAVAPAVAAAVKPKRLLITNEGARADANLESVKDPPTSTVFAFTTNLYRWNHADAEFRVSDGSYWPNFIAGRSDSGSVTWAAAGASGSFAATLGTWAQDLGKQDRRVLGQLYVAGVPPKVEFSLASFGPQATQAYVGEDRKGKPEDQVVVYQTVDATLTLGAKTLKLPFKAVTRRGKIVETSIQRLNVTAYATVKGRELGLTGDLIEKDIDIRVTVQGLDPQTIIIKKKGK